MDAAPPLCTEAEIKSLVSDFYDHIRLDEMLGPIFSAHIHNWDEHLGIMERFWSSLLLKTASYQGSPMAKHMRLDHLEAAHFEQWLRLFKQTCAERENLAMGEQALQYAQRIARSFWMNYQFHHNPIKVASDLTLP
ncbi:group III truncated hemoglobin [Alcaligenes endophyticus]|uniref:Group III truncated hemoglobin n=1 Tax=Alcaligenes endophyticus TaxID=1929088 RepID=A0ABT8EGS8_9BURK|nr:group III truncated hemoglobin [Alcaligenes endophyticus]MCX5589849.1 group III truncated hemoglobin [Alcaligenes endophyticus]MDN4120488.1 group III truncated hemoglobin [Alcaligenes endophyticus]